MQAPVAIVKTRLQPPHSEIGKLGEMMTKSVREAIFVLAFIFSFNAVAEPLVTQEEASRPNEDISGFDRGIFPGPTIILISPTAKDVHGRIIEASNIRSPFRLELAFQPHGGSKIDWNTFKVTYLKTPEVPLTSRLVPYKTTDGITVINAELPPGTHQFKVEVSDTDQIPSRKVIELIVVSGPSGP
jgi:hypothetical protein